MGRGVGSKDRASLEDFSPRYGERERRVGWGATQPSRKLWVGNLSPRINESVLSEQFLRYGDIENIAFLPGRNYAYVKFKKEEDAELALRNLHGSSVAGTPLRIEYAKGRKGSLLPQDGEYRLHKSERRSTERGEPHRRDFRAQHYSPEKYSDKSKSYKSSDPSEVLWIGFPSFLNIDEIMLRKAFSPFGEIEKITSFPGRSYAFVRYRSIVAACRAKEALQGKLFNNPRVSICFAKSDMSADQGKGLDNGPYSQDLKPKFFGGPSERDFEPMHGDEGFESPIREFQRISPPFCSNMDRARDVHAVDLAKNNSSRFGSSSYDSMRMRDFIAEQRSEEIFDRQRISPEERTSPPWHNRPYERPRRVPPFVEPWDTEEPSFPLAKKHKVELMPDKDLPEYPFTDLEQDKHEIQRPSFPDLRDHHSYNKPLDSIPFSLQGAHDFLRNRPRPHSEIDVQPFNEGSRPLPINTAKLQRSNTELHRPLPLNEMWKWEGTIAKGGTQVCRARCFPVGKVLDFMLPELLNCTARTGLDMLAKHYYQAECSWVVFFVPEGDADISFYNEFMHYLGEKQRAAVAKLGEKVTLFLVPPSDFSEHVLKVPGKVSISGVILKFQQNASNFTSLHHPMNLAESKVPPFTDHESSSYLKPNSPDFRSFSHKQNHTSSSSSSGYMNPAIIPPAPKQDERFLYPMPSHRGKLLDAHIDESKDQFQLHNPPLQPNWPSNKPVFNSVMSSYIPPPTQPFDRPFSREFSSINSRATATDSNSYTPETLPSNSAIKSIPLQPEQLAQLAAILGNQKQSGEELPLPKNERGKYSHFSQNPNSQAFTSMMHNNSSSVGQQMEQGAQLADAPPVQKEAQHTNQQEPKGLREDAESDPEKRLQATLQLAAALLQQIQQRSKPVD